MITEELPKSAGLKDLVVTILCGCDYYKEEEIRKLIAVMDGIANLPLHKRKKIKADNFCERECMEKVCWSTVNFCRVVWQ